MSTTVTTSQAFATLKHTLEEIVTDDTDGIEKGAVYKKYMKVEGMEDNYVDDLSNGGPGLATEKAEGQALDVLGLNNGYQTRYIARKFGLIMQVTEELDDDGKYNDKYCDFSRRMKRAVFKTMEVDCAQIFNRASNASYVGGDSVALASTAHTIPGGSSTFSNTLATAFSPSRAAVIVMTQNIMLLPGWDGVTEGYMPTAVVHPVAQWGAWKGILGSEKVPESGNNEINVANDMNLKQIAVPFWSASTTNWGMLTDAARLKLKVRKKPSSRTWYDEPTEIINHGTSARWARGWSDPRSYYHSNA